MSGFVRDYASVSKDTIHGEEIMRCVSPDRLPVLATLARQYGVSDRCFSSAPGSTIPNRMFVLGTSSAGFLTQDAVVGPLLLTTIFESFEPNAIHAYKIYTSGASILLANKYLVQHQGKSQTLVSSRRMPCMEILQPIRLSNRDTTTMMRGTMPTVSIQAFL